MSNTEALRKALEFIRRHCASVVRTNSRDRDDWAEDMAYVGKVAADALAQQPAASGEPVAWAVEACVDGVWSMQWPPRMGREAAESDLLQYRPGTVLRIRPLVFGAAPQPAPAPVPPEDWGVFNDSACVADGLSYAEALDYLTPERLQRGWSAVCVANRDNIVDGITAKEAP